MIRRNCLAAFAAVGLLTGSSNLVTAEIVFSDSFARTTGVGDGNTTGGVPSGTGQSDLGSNDNALGGTIVSSYVTSASRGGGANVTSGTDPDFPGNGSVASFFNNGAVVEVTGLTASAPNGFTVGFDFDRIPDPAATAPGPGGFIAFGLGAPSSPDPGTIGGAYGVSGNTAFGVLFQQANNGNTANGDVFENGINLSNGFDYLTPLDRNSVLLTFTPQTAGDFNNATSVIDYEVAVNGTSLSTGSFTNVDAVALDSLSFSSNVFLGSYIDNVVVDTVAAVPEPSSMAALAVVGLAGVRRIRRRRQA